MRLIESLKKRKLILFNIFLTLYVGTNLIGGERGLASYFEKRELHQENETKLIETTSDDFKTGSIFKKLEKKLNNHGVKFNPISKLEINKLIIKSFDQKRKR